MREIRARYALHIGVSSLVSKYEREVRNNVIRWKKIYRELFLSASISYQLRYNRSKIFVFGIVFIVRISQILLKQSYNDKVKRTKMLLLQFEISLIITFNVIF